MNMPEAGSYILLGVLLSILPGIWAVSKIAIGVRRIDRWEALMDLRSKATEEKKAA